MSDAAWVEIGVTDRHERWPILESMVRRQYETLFAAMPAPALMTFGNVDIPTLWPEYAREGHRIIDGEVIDVDGQRWGFVGGGLISPMRTPYEIDPTEYAAKLDTLGPVDVLFTHIPPHHALLNYDVVARRFEVGSHAIMDYIERHQPRVSFLRSRPPAAGPSNQNRSYRVRECRAFPRTRTTVRPWNCRGKR